MNTIILARPNAFLVNQMKLAVTSAGFTPVVMDSFEQLSKYDLSQARGCIISLAVNSSIGKSVEDVFQLIRLKTPLLPIGFATLTPLDITEKKLALMNISKEQLLPITATTLSHPRLASHNHYVVIHKDDITTPNHSSRASSIFQKHFSLAV